MWGKPPFSVADNCAVDVRNLSAALAWYKDKLGLHEAKSDREDDSGRPFVDLQIARSKNEPLLTLIELAPNSSPQSAHVIFFAGNLGKTRQWFEQRGVIVEPLTSDSGGNCFFRFRDLDGNAIEVCAEPK